MSRKQTVKRAAGAAARRLVLASLLGFSLPALAGTVSYMYDTLGRLKTATYGSVVITYTYDAAGNRLSRVTTGVP